MRTSTETQTLPAGTWSADAAHSEVAFAVDYMVGTFRGSFSPFEATLAVTDDGEAVLVGEARAESVRVQDPNLEAHLQSPEFFDAERTPAIRFRSTRVARDGDELVVEGELTIRDTTQDVELRGGVTDAITDPYGRERIGVRLGTTVDRTDFGLDWNAELPTGGPALANEVELTAELSLVKA